MNHSEIIIETIHLEQRFGPLRALAPLDLTIKTGTALALVGSNGSGKSTLLRLLMGFMPPTAGSARVFGHEAARLPERLKADIGYVAAGQDLPGGMTVAAYLQYLRPFYPGWDPAFERRLIELFRVPLSRQLRHLSRGQLAKAAIIGALSFHPRLLLLDEPFSGLDPAVRDEVEESLVEVMNAGEWTMVISSHEIDEVERLADEVLVLDGGTARLREDQGELLTRCRLVSLHGAKTPAGKIPESWWNFQTGDSGRATFLDSGHDPDRLAATVARLFPEAEPPTVRPAPLREIVRTLLHNNP